MRILQAHRLWFTRINQCKTLLSLYRLRPDNGLPAESPFPVELVFPDAGLLKKLLQFGFSESAEYGKRRVVLNQVRAGKKCG